MYFALGFRNIPGPSPVQGNHDASHLQTCPGETLTFSIIIFSISDNCCRTKELSQMQQNTAAIHVTNQALSSNAFKFDVPFNPYHTSKYQLTATIHRAITQGI